MTLRQTVLVFVPLFLTLCLCASASAYISYTQGQAAATPQVEVEWMTVVVTVERTRVVTSMPVEFCPVTRAAASQIPEVLHTATPIGGYLPTLAPTATPTAAPTIVSPPDTTAPQPTQRTGLAGWYERYKTWGSCGPNG